MEQCEKYFILRVFLVSQCVYGFFMINYHKKTIPTLKTQENEEK